MAHAVLTQERIYPGGAVMFLIDVTDPESGDHVDPAELTGMLRKPDGTQLTYVYDTDPEIERTGLGVFRFLIYLDHQGGVWNVRITTDDPRDAQEYTFTVRPSVFNLEE